MDDQGAAESPEEPAPQHLPPQQGRPGVPQNPAMMYGNYPTTDQQQQLAYSNYLAQQQRASNNYPGASQAGMAAALAGQHTHQA